MRNAVIALNYAGVDITSAIQNDLISFAYDEASEGCADSLAITLQNKGLKWMGAWLPVAGDKIQAALTSYDWNSKGEVLKLDCGTMEVDEPEFTGPPNIITLKALNIPAIAGFTDAPQDNTWDSISMSQLGQLIATKYGMSFSFDVLQDFVITALKQSQQTDADFLSSTAQKYNLCIKVYSNKLIIYSKYLFEQNVPVVNIEYGVSNISDYTLDSPIVGTGYSSCIVKYTPVNTSTVLEYEFSIASGGKTLIVQDSADDLGQAELIAKANLRTANEKQFTGSFTLALNLKVVAGCTVKLVGWGNFDGNWFVDTANQTYGSKTGETAITIHKCLTGGY